MVRKDLSEEVRLIQIMEERNACFSKSRDRKSQGTSACVKALGQERPVLV